MLRTVTTRLVIQKSGNTKDKYYPTVVKASTAHSFPFSVPTADIEIVTNTRYGTRGYTSPIRADDIVRLQVAITHSRKEKFTWRDLFEGRIQSIKSSFGTKNTSELHCVGHMEESTYSLIEETKTYSSATDARTILAYFVPKYKRMLTYDSNYADVGVTISSYNTTANQTYMSDLFTEVEKCAGADWFIDCIPIYDDDLNLQTVYLSWKAFPEETTEAYKVMEYADSFISADFECSLEDLITRCRISGDTPPDETPDVTVHASVTGDPAFANQTITGSPCIKSAQYSYGYTSSSAETTYGRRSMVETYTWIKSQNQCAAMSYGILKDRVRVQPAGSVTLIGTPAAHICDKVRVYLPSIEVNGAIINSVFYVSRVQHEIGDTFTTTIDLGKIQKTAYDYIGSVSTCAKILRKNFCRG